jgi:O-antigen/teichoic acid export membrane protein
VIARSNVYFALVNLALDAALIPPFSAAGATAATVLTFAGQAVYMERWNRALFPFPEERGRMLKAVAAAAAAFAAAKAVPLDSIALEFAWAVGAVLLYPVGLTVLGFWSEEEKALAGRVRARVFGRRPAAAARPAAVLEGPPDAPAG